MINVTLTPKNPLQEKSAIKVTIDAKGKHYKQLNEEIRRAIEAGAREIELVNVNGQRYIGDAVNQSVKIVIRGVPGQDLAAFNNGADITVLANAQDGVGNTMNAGKVVVHGSAGDVLGYGMRGGKLFIRGDVGYRVGIHMKAYKNNIPVIVVGGSAADFFGEYMAGGILVLLGLKGNGNGKPIVGSWVGTGMHGGVIYLRGKVEQHQLGKEVGIQELTEEDKKELRKILEEYCREYGLKVEEIMKENFVKLVPVSHRPYGRLYAY